MPIRAGEGPFEAEENSIEEFEESEIKPLRVSLQTGYSITLYADGIADIWENWSLFEQEQLKDSLVDKQALSAEELVSYLETSILTYHRYRTTGYPALLIIKMPEHKIFRLNKRLPAELVAVKQSRRLLKNLIAGLPDLPWKTVELLVSELTTNAICHGNLPTNQQWIEMRLSCNGHKLRVEVINPGTCRLFNVNQASPNDCGGRGLWLVDTLSDRWGNHLSLGTTQVWFEFDLDSNQSDLGRNSLDTHWL